MDKRSRDIVRLTVAWGLLGRHRSRLCIILPTTECAHEYMDSILTLLTTVVRHHNQMNLTNSNLSQGRKPRGEKRSIQNRPWNLLELHLPVSLWLPLTKLQVASETRVPQYWLELGPLNRRRVTNLPLTDPECFLFPFLRDPYLGVQFLRDK